MTKPEIKKLIEADKLGEKFFGKAVKVFSENKDHTEYIEKILANLANNPANLVMKAAVSLDLSDYEQLRT